MSFRALRLLCFLSFAACGGSETVPVRTPTTPPEMAFVRANRGIESDVEIYVSTRQGLNRKRLARSSGREEWVRAHPDGKRLVFMRERTRGRADSREIYVNSWDGSTDEERLTVDRFEDSTPCWSPDGSTILFATNRAGGSQIWRMAADGSLPVALTSGPAADDAEPDWRNDLVVFRRINRTGAAPRAQLFAMAPNSANLRQLTDGGAGTGTAEEPAGDYEPAIAPDGSRILFSRVLAPGQRALMELDLTSNTIRRLDALPGLSEIRWPRFSPRNDRLFAAVSIPALGREGLRLCELRPDGSDPVWLRPDKRFDFRGLDPLPTMPAYVAPEAQQTADLDAASIEVTTGQRLIGNLDSLRASGDNDELRIRTRTFQGREIASIWVRQPLPIPSAERLAIVEGEIIASLDTVREDSALRITVYNVVQERFDTVAEFEPKTAGPQTLSFRIGSLEHIDRSRRVRVEVIGDLSQGDRAELRVDRVTLKSQASPQPDG